jgi:oligopeptide/dipeptide ABC transporter ATP-binding protein
MKQTTPLIEIKNLKVNFFLDEGTVEAIKGVHLDIPSNRTLGVVGESGCGKSVLSQALLRIIPSPGKIVEGEILYHPQNGNTLDLVKLDEKGKKIRSIRGSEIAMIFQEPMTAFSPLYTIGNQVMETIILHQKVDKTKARERAVEMLKKVGIPRPDIRIDQYPFELSGGLRQRAMIAMALSCNPALLVADEPTTALDVTVQAQILRLMKDIQDECKMAMVFISHDLAVISEVADEVAVMYLGRVVERASAAEIFSNPKHPYTHGLLKSIPTVESDVKNRLIPIAGTVPDPFKQISGCPFFDRCPDAMPDICQQSEPALDKISYHHEVACHLLAGSN